MSENRNFVVKNVENSIKSKEIHSLRVLQQMEKNFDKKMGWENFSPSQIFIHLIEELGEIGSHLLWKSGYKSEAIGHKKSESDENLKSEFGQCLSLFLHLANSLDIDIQDAYLNEQIIMKKRFRKE